MTDYDLCVAWNWPYDAGFVGLLERACHERGLSVLHVTPDNLVAIHQALLDGQVAFRAFMNRATDTDAEFMKMVDWACGNDTYCINPYEREAYSADKATMHLEFLTAGLRTPYTIILAPFAEQPHLAPLDLSPLGETFAIKPATGGGGRGVVCEATAAEQVYLARQEYPDDKYLLQAHVTPAGPDGQPAWFRVIYCLGQVYPCWWPPATRIYRPVCREDVIGYGLGALYDMVVKIARLCRLHLFSTEIALTPSGEFVVVDYVNDQIDLRLQSQAADGVPDAIVHDICRRLAADLEQHCQDSTAGHHLQQAS